MKKITPSHIEKVAQDAWKASPEQKRDFLKRKVGRWLMAQLFGSKNAPDMKRADRYLYGTLRLEWWEKIRIDECYVAARLVDELRRFDRRIDKRVARSWLMLASALMEDHAPILAIRDGLSYNHLSAVGAAKTFVLRQK